MHLLLLAMLAQPRSCKADLVTGPPAIWVVRFKDEDGHAFTIPSAGSLDGVLADCRQWLRAKKSKKQLIRRSCKKCPVSR